MLVTSPAAAPPQVIAPVAVAEGLGRDYGTRRAVDEVSFTVSGGRTTMLVGPNGSGKTTTMEMLAGLREPTRGRAVICGVPVRPGGAHRLLMGVQLQESGLPSRLRVQEALSAVASLFAEAADTRALADRLGLADHWRTPVDKLSGGLRRRLDIAAACVGRPRFLMLDEPTSGVDPEGRAELWAFLRDLAATGVGVLASTHDLGEAEAFADQLLVMGSGRIVLKGAPAAVVAGSGGAWRLRVHGLPDRGLQVVRRSGLRWSAGAGTVVALGDREAVEALRDRLADDACDHGGDPPETLTGRARLEDVFAVTTREAHE